MEAKTSGILTSLAVDNGSPVDLELPTKRVVVRLNRLRFIFQWILADPKM
jgi:hypothetical protein